MKKVLKTLQGHHFTPPPTWLMRQAGRYLPEYQKIRKTIPHFMDICYNPDIATELTCQPIRRFDFDAAIIFNDILIIPDALGQKVSFAKNHGPILAPYDPGKLLNQTEDLNVFLNPMYQALQQVRAQIPSDKTLLGFAGAPWTLSTYMVEEGKSITFSKALQWLTTPESSIMLGFLTDIVADFLINQIRAGADAVQLFDSWAQVVPESMLTKAIITPVRTIIQKIHAVFPETPVIYFSKGMNHHYTTILKDLGPVAVSVDASTPFAFITNTLQPLFPVQGNLDPEILREGGYKLTQSVENILEQLSSKPFIFNLGHGILPNTPIAHVEKMLSLIRG